MTNKISSVSVISLIEDERKTKRRSKFWHKLIMPLAVVVVFATTYALIIPALTVNSEPHCGLEEHTHTDACYADVLICGFDETEAATEAVTEAETSARLSGHTHTDECYEEVRTLICALEETAGHTHTEECYDGEGNLVCTLEETAGHTHTDECYAVEERLICTLEESTEAEQTEAPETVAEPVAAAQTHVHTAECYERQLVCGLVEHTHCTQCYSDFDADLENELSWSAALKNAKLTGNWREDIIAIAKTQLGYTESEANYLVSVVEKTNSEEGENAESQEILNGYTRYGAWYKSLKLKRADSVVITVDEQTGEITETPDLRYMDWDTLFVSFCIRMAEIPEEYFPIAENASELLKSMLKEEYNCIRYDFENMQPGDIVFFDKDHDKIPEECAVYYEYDEDADMYKFISGNIDSESVAYIERLTSNSSLYGYAVIPENPDHIAETEAVETEAEPIERVIEETEETLETAGEETISEETVSEVTFDVTETSADEETAVDEKIVSEETVSEETSDSIETSVDEETVSEEIVEETVEVSEEETSYDEEAEEAEETEESEETDEFFDFWDIFDPTYESDIDESDIEDTEDAETEEEEEITEEELSETTIEITTDDGVTVTVTGKLPQGASIRLMNLDEETIAQILEQVGAENFFFAYDITVIDESGNIWQPDELGAKVSITGIEVPEGDVEIVHLPDDGEAELVEDVQTIEGGEGIEFTAEGFSPYIGYSSSSTNVSDSLNATASSSTSNSAELTVTLTGDDKPDSLTVTLYKDGAETTQTATLSSSNSYTYTFTGLDSSSEYTVAATDVSGYSFSLGTPSTKITESDPSYTKATSLTSGGKYVLVHNTSYAVQNSSGTSLSRSSVTVSGDTITSSVTDAMLWKYNGTSLQNVSTSNYLRLYSTGNRQKSYYAITSSSNQDTITYNNSKIYDSTSRLYLSYSSSKYTSSNSGTTITLYQYTAGTTVTTTSVTITSTAVSSGGDDDDDGDDSGGGGDNPTPDTPVEASFVHNKQIDKLNDDTANPDTDADDNATDDDYRLYLDMTGKVEPIDLLIVVDKSYSMYGNKDMTFNGKTSQYRYAAVDYFLNDEVSTKDGNTYTGFIDYFLGLNAGNKVSVIYFGGNGWAKGPYKADNGWPSGDTNVVDSTTLLSPHSGSYYGDVGVLADWGNTVVDVDCFPNYDGTNYEAALNLATTQFSAVAGDNHRKVMLFISDGVPTMFEIDESDVGKTYKTTITSADVGKRFGDGNSGDNITYCNSGTALAIEEFIANNPTVTVFAVGVSKSINDETSESSNPALLKQLASGSGGAYVGVTTNMSELKLELESIFFPKGVTITDTLSKYVRYNSDNPDVLVTMIEKSTGDVYKVLWDGTSSLDTDIFDTVTYTPGDTSEKPSSSTGTVKAIFNSSYELLPDYTYTLSFNVKTTQTAYDEYVSNGKSYGGVKGDSNTDYKTNATSSGMDGFHSNSTAYVTYKVSSSDCIEYYVHPVIQVTVADTVKVTVKKIVAGGELEKKFSFTLTYTKDDESNSFDFELGNEETKTIEDIPKGATVKLVENNSEGYSVIYSIEGESMDDSRKDYVVNQDTNYTITNVPGAVMPATGGSGTGVIYTAGISLALISLAAIAIINRKSKAQS